MAMGLLCGASLSHAQHREMELGGTSIFGLDPSWSAGREFDKALDGDSSTYYDYAYSADAGYVGFDNGDSVIPVEIHFTARKGFSKRMIGGEFQGSSVSSTEGFETIYTVDSDPGESAQVITLDTDKDYRYFRYLAPVGSYGNIAEFSMVVVEVPEEEVLPELPAEPEGFRIADVNGVAVFGLDPAWRGGREFTNVFDGNEGSYYDYKYDDRETFVGFDQGEALVPVAIHFAPRSKFEERMIGGRFEASNESPYSGYETIYEVTEEPASGASTVVIDTTNAYRYFRYVAPEGSYGNIAEFSMDLEVPTQPSEPTDPEPTDPEPTDPEVPSEPIDYPDGYRESVSGETIIFGLDPAWKSGRSFENAFDGNASSYYDYKYGDRETFVGFDSGEAIVPEQIVFQARGKFSKRLVGGVFQGSNESSVTGYETIYEVRESPSADLQTVELDTTKAYRYFRYLAPVGSYGNIAEFSVLGSAPAVEEEPVDVDRPFLSAEPIEGQNGMLLSFTLEHSGQVSAAIYDLGGKMVRTLLEGVSLEAGSHEVVWDGLDRDGDVMPQGEYTLKLLQGDGLRAEYVTSLGINPGSNDYDTWVGNHDGGSSIAVDSTGMYIAAQVTETAPVLIKQSLDGSERLWTKIRGDVTIERFQGGVSLASDDNGTLYMLQQNGYLQVIDTETGKLKSSWDVLPSSESREMWNYLSDETAADADMAAYAGALVLSFSRDDMLQWRDPSNGSVLAELSISAPRGVAVVNVNEVLVASGTNVYRVNRNGNAELVISGLRDPQRLSIDRSNNTILVTDGYIDCQVKRYSFTGTLLATHGRLGGRLDGVYVPTDFNGVSDIAADNFGGFIVAEPLTGARRVAHFNKTGSLVNEWFGGQPYYAWAEPDPRDPSMVWFYSGNGLVFAELDIAGKSWSVKETWDLETLASGLIKEVQGHRGSWRVIYQNDQRYLISESTAQVLVHREGSLRAVSISSDDSEQKQRASEIAGRANDFKVFRWLDANGDGEAQSNEFTFSAHSNVPDADTITDDFSLITHNRQDQLTINKTEALWSPYGPYYPIGNEGGVNVPVASAYTEIRASDRGTGAFMSSDGDYYAHYNVENEGHGVFWPTDWAGISRFVKLDAEGNEVWRVGRHAYQGGLAGTHNTTYVDTPSGQLHVPVKVIGETEDAIILADRVENPALAWTKDGLYMGALLDHHVADGLPDTVYVFYATETGEDAITSTDNASGGRLIRYDDGTVLWFTQGRNNVPVYQITGWNDFERTEVNFELSASAKNAEATGTGLSVEYFTGKIDQSASVTGIETQVWNGVPYGSEGHDNVIDGRWGNVYDWTNGPEMLNQATNFSARWRGELEAPLSEDFTFSIYARGGVRFWINGHLIINSWNEVTERFESAPVRLVAGERYNIQLDYRTSQDLPSLSLNWESRSQDRERIPSEFLYPVLSAPVYEPVLDATDYIDAPSFDIESGAMNEALMDEYSVRGYRQWGFGFSGAYLGYSDIDFGEGVSSIEVEAAGRPSATIDDFPVIIEFRLDSPTGEKIASVTLDSEMQVLTVPVSGLSGIHDVYAVNVTTNKWHHIEFNWFKFQ